MAEDKIIWEPPAGDSEELRAAMWEECRARAMSCRKCELCAARTNVVFGEGDRRSKLMFIGEGPGEEEDLSGRPFVGRAGELLTKILEAAGIARADVYIANIVKCRPPGNRTPRPEEASACDEYLQAQIMLIAPAVMVLLGNTPTKWLLNEDRITKVRGKWYTWRGISVMPMFHPSYLLRNQSKAPGSPKALSWDDIREVKRKWDEARMA